MKRKRKTLVDLPEDLIVEILSRVPAFSLSRLRSTSRKWNHLVKEENFAKKHYANTAARKDSSLVIMLVASRVSLVSVNLNGIQNNVDPSVKVIGQFILKDPVFDNSSVAIDKRSVFHCDGLLLLSTECRKGLVVCNPCLGEIRWILPRDSYKMHDYFALGKSSCNKYKILRLDQPDFVDPTLVEFEVYDFTLNSWRVVGKTRDWFIPRSKGRGVYVKGHTYWLACTQNNMPRRDLIISFDFSTESFATVPLPGNVFSSQVVTLSVTREDEKLCLVATQSGQIRDVDVWIASKIERLLAKKGKKKKKPKITVSWSKIISVSLASLQQPFYFNNGMNLLVDGENKVIVCRCKNDISKNFLHVVGEGKCILVGDKDKEYTRSLVVSYVPSFVWSMQKERNRAIHLQ